MGCVLTAPITFGAVLGRDSVQHTGRTRAHPGLFSPSMSLMELREDAHIPPLIFPGLLPLGSSFFSLTLSAPPTLLSSLLLHYCKVIHFKLLNVHRLIS